MKIVVLDGFTANPGDLSWEGLSRLGETTVYERTSPDQVLDRARGAEIVLTNKVVLDGSTLRQLPDLKYIGILATGTNVVDLAVAKRLGITVTNIPAYSTMSVAQNVFALLLELTNRVGRFAREFDERVWSSRKDFSYTDGPLTELAGKRFGIVGYGNIGHAVAAIAKAFGMEVFVSSRRPQDELPGVTKLDTDTLFSTCDVVSLHCPLTPETQDLVDSRRLGLMKKTAILINTGRGPLVDEAALARALREGMIGGAGLDVLCKEPPAMDNPLIGAPNCVVTPHVSWATVEARRRLLDIAAENVAAFLAGKPQNTVA